MPQSRDLKPEAGLSDTVSILEGGKLSERRPVRRKRCLGRNFRMCGVARYFRKWVLGRARVVW